MKSLDEIRQKDEKLSIGLISGTSMDGVDSALVRLKGSGLGTELELLHFITFPYPHQLQEKLFEISHPGQGTTEEICQYNVVLGEVFADAVKALLDEARIESAEVDFIGSHGQTIHHLPTLKDALGYTIVSTLQIGEPSVIAKRTGILTVADFRHADMAMGGQGAPLVPYLDFTLFRSLEKNRGLLNIGGIANLTILKKAGTMEGIVAFDTGPGNMVIDSLMERLFAQPYDEGGKIACSGQVSEELLEVFAHHEYFELTPPKSTGREDFGEDFCSRFLIEARKLHLRQEDIISTATEFTVWSVGYAYREHVEARVNLDEIIVSGGGTENEYIMAGLERELSGVEIASSDKYGIPSAAKEAVCFAVLANETVCGNPSNVPSATGATVPTILGKICF
ncbi:MAG: anhydro-N-acetylmuramic acid kinase [bacterium]